MDIKDKGEGLKPDDALAKSKESWRGVIDSVIFKAEDKTLSRADVVDFFKRRIAYQTAIREWLEEMGSRAFGVTNIPEDEIRMIREVRREKDKKWKEGLESIEAEDMEPAIEIVREQINDLRHIIGDDFIEAGSEKRNVEREGFLLEKASMEGRELQACNAVLAVLEK